MIKIDIGNGLYTVVDDEDIPLIIGKAIRSCDVGGRIYARISLYGDGIKEKRVKLHHFLMKPSLGFVVDHINGDILDNRRENLRVCTQCQNLKNSRRRSHSKNPYKGVYKSNGNGNRWNARITSDGKYTYIGSFDTAEDAAMAYNEMATRLHGQYAKLNQINESEEA